MNRNKKYKSDIDIAQQVSLFPIKQLAENYLELNDDEFELFGKYKAKLSLQILERLKNKPSGKVVLVTSINPTPAGEGKSTVTVGLAQALNQLNKRAIVALREPSLGPTLGMKGGATGGGYSQVLPMDDINLHFTGDLHAITTANNALAAFIDNHIHQGNEVGIDPRRIIWKRVLDLNDRALRYITIGLGGPTHGVPREDHFDITVASEIMAILCLADSLADLRSRLAEVVIGYTYSNKPVTVADIGYEGALTLILKEAIKPNLVQTLEHTPAIIHGGPFANIAHGCNSLLATKMAAKLGDYVVTEAGFGADLGAEKFLNIKARIGKIHPSGVVIVATIRALKMHGGLKKNDLQQENTAALILGFSNLKKHIETIKSFGLPYVVAINKFITDTDKEIKTILDWCHDNSHPAALCEVWEHGGKGGIDLAKKLLKTIDEEQNQFKHLYDTASSIKQKIFNIANIVYGATGVQYTSKAEKQMNDFDQFGWSQLPICMAKTQYSLTDEAHVLGRPENFTITIREFKISLGAGFIVAITGNIMTMPGLPKKPAALSMDVNDEGLATGLF
ncbi:MULTISPECIES: formate--tetrahydrofolate ligase [Metabacillus]|uniref:Formate--tetrahydrofolate ligase n=2 Tax=Metabacillus TaxID=2675233 RepID=A0A179T0L7_9BACI|nr:MULTISPECIES: formate--tetrahydrofolate ligase [Metabacillus]OAS86083.1 formate--tetrahydrofolate ligase [Metabacillus litoralis]QNF30582.1 formate--tetrahydrofolate ligase [Metabacillus sp. KUDC1714]